MKINPAKLITLFILLMPLVNALSIDPLPYNTYNMGDNILISGKSEQGFITLNLKCNEQKSFLGTTATIKETYSKIISLTGITGAIDDCRIQASSGNETTESNSFKLTNELIGEFTVSHNELQLGDGISIQGYITKLNKNPIDGTATIYFKKDNLPYNIDTLEIKSGNLNYNKDVLIPAGLYLIDIEATDNFGNKQLFTGISTLKVNTDLMITYNLDKSSYKPEDTLKLNGYVLKTTGDKPMNLNIVVLMDNKTYNFISDKFDITYLLPADIKSYKHDITIEAIDEIGNKGLVFTQFYVNPIPTYLTLELNTTKFKPEDTLTIKSTLYDQANDFLSDLINIEIRGNDIAYSAKINSGQPFSYKIPEFSKPGEYRVKIESNNLKQEKIFYIEEVKDIDVSLNGQILNILNIGNVIYNKDLIILGNDIEKIIPLYIKSNATYSIELYKLFENGEYTIKIPLKNKEFNNINIYDDRSLVEKILDFFSDSTGASVTKINKKIGTVPIVGKILFSVILFAIFFLIILLISIQRKIIKEKVRKKEHAEGQRRLSELKRESQKYKFDFGKAKKEDIEDFRNRVIKSYKEIEQQEQRHKSFYESDKPKKIEDYDKKDEGNAFRNMFG